MPTPNPSGTYAVYENHDWRYAGRIVRSALEANKTIVMENNSSKVADAFGELWMVGLADKKIGRLTLPGPCAPFQTTLQL